MDLVNQAVLQGHGSKVGRPDSQTLNLLRVGARVALEGWRGLSRIRFTCDIVSHGEDSPDGPRASYVGEVVEECPRLGLLVGDRLGFDTDHVCEVLSWDPSWGDDVDVVDLPEDGGGISEADTRRMSMTPVVVGEPVWVESTPFTPIYIDGSSHVSLYVSGLSPVPASRICDLLKTSLNLKG